MYKRSGVVGIVAILTLCGSYAWAASNDCIVVASTPTLIPGTSAPCQLNTSGEQLVTGAGGGGGGTFDGILRSGTGGTTQANVTNGRLHVDVPALTIGNFPATQPVSALSLPLPTGAATAALQNGIIKSGAGGTEATVLNGRLLVDNLNSNVCTANAKTFVPISQTANTQLVTGTASNRVYVCSFMVTQASASTQTYSLVNGTGTTCGTGTAAMIGGATAATGMHLPLSLGGGVAAVAKSTADASNVCLLQSGTDRLAGVMSVVQAAP